jgi:hypothetical protein
LKIIHCFEPDEIWLATPGPRGLLGLLMAGIFQAGKVGFLYGDLGQEAAALVGDEDVTTLVEDYCRWFYGHMDEVIVPSAESARNLAAKGLIRSRLKTAQMGAGEWLATSQAPGSGEAASPQGPEDEEAYRVLLDLLGGEAETIRQSWARPAFEAEQ